MAASSTFVIYAALVGNLLIAIIKFIAATITGSTAMLAEGVHSLVDTGNQGLVLYGLRRARKPADDAFPFGYGKEVYFWSFAVAVQLFTVGAGVSVYKGIKHLLHPEPVQDATAAYIVLGLSALFEGASWYLAVAEVARAKGKWTYLEAVTRGKDPSRFVVLFEDSAAMLGLVIAFAGIFLGQITGSPYFDGAASVTIGLILACTAVWFAYETKGLLIGESADRQVVRDIREIAGSLAQVHRVNEVLTMHIGPNFILANISIAFAPNIPASEVERAISMLDGEIKRAHPKVKRIFIEAESQREAAMQRST